MSSVEKFDQGVVQQGMQAGATLWLDSRPTEAVVKEDGVVLNVESQGQEIELVNFLLVLTEHMVGRDVIQNGVMRNDDWLSSRSTWIR